MIIGIPKETKSHEYRVSMLPVGVELLVQSGHKVLFQKSAGLGSGYEDAQYQQAGATLIDHGYEVFSQAQMIIKVKEPRKSEWLLLQRDQILFTYFHFASNRQLTQACLDAQITAIAYETLTGPSGTLPLLTPMSEIAGRMSIQEGAKYLEKPTMGRGILLGGVPGVEAGEVLILGGGVVGTHAARMAAGLGARVVIMDTNLERLRYLADVMPPNVHTVYSDPHAIAEYVPRADLVIGAVLIPGGRTPVLISKQMLSTMKTGAVIVDVGVDQGGCVQTSHPTSHAQPTFIVDGVVHYCVSNMPGAVGRTSTQALCHATQPYILKLANSDLDQLLASDPAFATALNMRDGKITHDAVAKVFAES